ncbi:chromosome-associated kinesin KIF4 [Daktulosphaira vitifoliae]|uniref:chromosome-associated kinesin KIF4 n=1 Tax=Daktulosphaira vitifoliae TaxID=58002 RepID=UPI0021AABA11|nr:chromosome-associated kinesin KIF4 [Daktulosphaira vitifoliae]
MDAVKVAIRIRPLVKSELERGCSNCVLGDPINQQIIVNNNANLTFTFNYVFTPEHSQSHVYELAVEDLVQKLFSGYNVTILAYGQTGSGKTHSMGTNFVDSNEEEKGIIPRAIQNIYNEVQKKTDSNFTIKASFIELYQEQVYDLLSPNKATLDIREDGRGICIPGLTEIGVNNFDSTLQCLVQGSSGRATGATAMNAQSSRSHCIFTLTISQVQDDGNSMTAKFHLVDLAGSERSKKTKATGERFKEGVNINKGLLSLGNVITSLCEKSAHVSYRDSKLTRLLQDSLGGNSVTLMIACISPADYNMDETVSTLRYANRALQIKNKPIINQDPITAQLTALSKENHELKLKIVAMEANGVTNCPPEHNELQKCVKDYQDKIRSMSQVLSEYMTQSASLNMKALMAETGRETMKKHLQDLASDFENALKTNNVEEFKNIKQKISYIMDEHNRTEVEICSDDYVTANEDMDDDQSECDNETDQTKEQMVMETIQLNRELNKLNKELAMKEHLAAKLIESVSHIGEYCPEEDTEELKNKLEQLKQERDQLEEALKVAQSNNICTKLAEQRRKKLQELENKIASLTKKCLEQDRIIKMKAKNDQKVESLNNEIKSIKVMKVKLIQQMKSENEKFRQFKLERDRELCRLRENERKQKNQMIRMERLHVRQQTALKRKLEDAANVNKRLKDALAVRKAIEVKRDEAFMPKAQRIQKWVDEELDVLMSTVDAEKTLEQLEMDRETICKMMQRCEDQLETTGLTDEFKYGLKMDKKEMAVELQLRSAQIMELRQKIFDSNEELMKKTRFDHLTTVADTKTALKHAFHVAAENRRTTLELQNQIDELKAAINEAKENLLIEQKKTLDVILKNQKHVELLQKDYEDNILVLLRQLNEKEKSLSTVGTNNDMCERLRIYDEQLSKFEQLREELSQKDKLISDLQSLVNSSSNSVKSNVIKSPITPINLITDDSKENDIESTPLRRRLDKLKRESRMFEKSDERLNRMNFKRNAEGHPMCLCIKNCLKNICMCYKKSMSCSKYCKCSEAVCTNRHSTKHESIEEEPSDIVLNQTFKKPKTEFMPTICDSNYEISDKSLE